MTGRARDDADAVLRGSAFAVYVYCNIMTLGLPTLVLVGAGLAGGPLLVLLLIVVGLPHLLWRLRGTYARVDGSRVIVRNLVSTHVLEQPVRMCHAKNRCYSQGGSDRGLKDATGRSVVVHAALRLTESGGDAADAWLHRATRRCRR